jgi:hypothetical protein
MSSAYSETCDSRNYGKSDRFCGAIDVVLLAVTCAPPITTLSLPCAVLPLPPVGKRADGSGAKAAAFRDGFA